MTPAEKREIQSFLGAWIAAVGTQKPGQARLPQHQLNSINLTFLKEQTQWMNTKMHARVHTYMLILSPAFQGHRAAQDCITIPSSFEVSLKNPEPQRNGPAILITGTKGCLYAEKNPSGCSSVKCCIVSLASHE
ncbi:hypothetical protein Y1Q_0004093 [Alligator mississippiensis]|uniref:Uncharacterized protein n=1 Tax=Alligator mississippiensis TaxID=8496 RepID=A0A151PI94_ALLMI|nr:hypothetical protein Y1Q_0004093 [Alligator mississippiensis]